ncbi:YfhD family protein [Paenibacillus sp. UNC499MF]|uniref:YfhD family protein n=1 Tax=Paenibacillus sp. UNC499MF TaxID=1502751 RepID=UPI0008A0259F|nr:YfhD family protein [Paenibacillus sp. UNC499MF]SEF48644.1 YfhD-like protein [Paenibacillus sp. UNC499MF]
MSENRNEQAEISEEISQLIPIGKNEDVEFSSEAADAEDLEALQRANAADSRQERQGP